MAAAEHGHGQSQAGWRAGPPGAGSMGRLRLQAAVGVVGAAMLVLLLLFGTPAPDEMGVERSAAEQSIGQRQLRGWSQSARGSPPATTARQEAPDSGGDSSDSREEERTPPSSAAVVRALLQRKGLEVLAQMPEDTLEDICGPWVKSYAAFHRRSMAAIRANPAAPSPPIVVYRCSGEDTCGGLGDRTAGLTGLFLHALVYHRLFLVDWAGLPDILVTRSGLNLTYDAALLERPPSTRTIERLDYLNCEKDTDVRPFAVCPIPRAGSGASLFQADITIGTRANRGMSLRAFGNDAVRPLVEALGLRKLTCFGCSMHFLFDIHPAVLGLISPITVREVLDPTQVVLGIHIRVGDVVFLGDHDRAERGARRIKRLANRTRAAALRMEALLVSQGLVPANARFRWLVLSDSTLARKRVLHNDPRKGIATGITPLHMDRDKDTHAAQTTLAEWLLLSACDYFVIDGHSGFSRTAVVYGLRDDAAILRPQSPKQLLEAQRQGEPARLQTVAEMQLNRSAWF